MFKHFSDKAKAASRLEERNQGSFMEKDEKVVSTAACKRSCTEESLHTLRSSVE